MFRPAGYFSDSDEDSEFGYDFGYSKEPKSKARQSPPKIVENNDDNLYKAVLDENLSEISRILEIDRYLLTGCLRQGWPLLLLACSEAKHDVVKYLLEEKRLDVNEPYGLKTALMTTCESTRSPEAVLKVADLLLEFGAVINCKDSYGMTPLMFAIINGHTEVVKLILDQASLEATDNEGLTALFHAVNNKRVEIVQMLLKAGAETDIVNRRGFTPKQEAEFKGYLEIAQLFPTQGEFYNIPIKYLQYASYQDISQGENEKDLPGFHPEIGLLLFGMYSEQHLGVFAKEDFDLMRFLTVTDDELMKLGFELPFERKKILYGMIKFHRQAWSKRSMKKFSKEHTLDSYDLMEMISNHLKQLTVMQASLMYVAQMMSPSNVEFHPQLDDCLKCANQLNYTVTTFGADLERIHRLTAPKPVMHIDAERCRGKRGRWVSRVIKISILSGIVSFIVYRRLKN